MCGRAYQPRFLFTWPSSRCSVMGPDQLAGVMEIVQSGSRARKNNANKSDAAAAVPKEPSNSREKQREMVERESESYYTSANLLDDGIIDPRDTRDILGMCLDVVTISPVKGAKSHQGLARL